MNLRNLKIEDVMPMTNTAETHRVELVKLKTQICDLKGEMRRLHSLLDKAETRSEQAVEIVLKESNDWSVCAQCHELTNYNELCEKEDGVLVCNGCLGI